MKEGPIIFNTENVKAILEGRKTMTRRVCKGARELSCVLDWPIESCPYGQVGNRLWVRESLEYSSQGIPTRYVADGCPVMRDGESIDWPFKKSPLPSIFMPRWASRINLEITEIRVERLQEITEEDAKAEGIIETQCNCGECIDSTYAGTFWYLWESINAKRGYPWESNPWVWVISFKKV